MFVLSFVNLDLIFEHIGRILPITATMFVHQCVIIFARV